MALVLIGLAIFLVSRGWDQEAQGDDPSPKNSQTKTERKGPKGSANDGDPTSRVVSKRKMRNDSDPVVTDSGLQYVILEEGTGPRPGPTSRVKVHYVGSLDDGTVFDSSRDRGTPAVFPLNQVIKGWTEGLQLMKEGAKYRFVIPPDLAYGENGARPAIPGNATLTFEVELISIEEP